jgi:acyl-CoA thioester hydrolase
LGVGRSQREEGVKAPEPRITRKDYPHFLSMPTRWMDNDVYGHVNNVIYYSFFDTLIN